VELINLLTSFNFPHTYDGIMAGTVAWMLKSLNPGILWSLA
jgi:hypothetical protein